MRRELIVCDICKATRNSDEQSGASIQIFPPDHVPIVGDLCDDCFAKILKALDAGFSEPSMTGGPVSRRLLRRPGEPS